MFTVRLFRCTNMVLILTFLSGCGGGSGSSSNDDPVNPTTSSTAISSSSSSVPVAKMLSEIDVVKQTKPSIKFLQYSEALVLFTNETLALLKKMEQAQGDVTPDLPHSCEQNQGTYIITTAM